MELLGNMPELPDGYAAMRTILSDYYTLRSEKYSNFTSFSYSDAIRVFKTDDVIEYIAKTGNVLRSELAKQISPSLTVAMTYDIVSERLRKERIFNWISSDELNELLQGPLPPGVGPDDGRLVIQAIKFLEDRSAEDTSNAPVVFLLLSGDRQLGRSIGTTLRVKFPRHAWVLYQIQQAQYIGLCLSDVRDRVEGEPPFDPDENIRLWNYIRNAPMVLPRAPLTEIRKSVRELGGDIYVPIVLYDFPNLERAIEPTYYDDSTQSVVEQHGGFLRAQTMSNFPKLSSWAAQPMDLIAKANDFSTSFRTKYPIREFRSGSRKYYNKPLSTSSFRNINEWSSKTDTSV
jgi:hypothetical protein